MAPDDPAKLAKMKATEGLDFPILVDPESRVIKSWGILNESSGKIPHPTAAIIDGAGVLRYLRVDTDYKVRPSAEELLNALRKLE